MISVAASANKGNDCNVKIRGVLNIIAAVFFLIFYPKIYIHLTIDNPPHPTPLILGSYDKKTWISSQTISKIIVAETPFGRCDLHTVENERGKIVEGWLFFEQQNVISVVVTDGDGRFIVLRQRKYAIEGWTYSPVAGLIDDGESPYDAAKREVSEELGLGSRRSFDGRRDDEKKDDNRLPLPSSDRNVDDAAGWNPDGTVDDDDPDWVHLGTFRTDADRGAGFSYLYLLKNAVPLVEGEGTSDFVGTGDDEKQEILKMSPEEVYENLGRGQFKEVKWATAVSLALHHLNGDM